MLDIFNENYEYLGTSSKEEVHKKGYWHQVASCMFINSSTNKIYMQYKNASHNPVKNQNKIDITAGGHINAGENIEEGLIREIFEESNYKLKISDIRKVGFRKIDIQPKEDYIIKEFQYLYIYDNNIDLSKLKSIDDEVLYFIEFDIDELFAYINNPKGSIIGKTTNGNQSFKRQDFIKGYLEDDKLYFQYLQYIKQIINDSEAS